MALIKNGALTDDTFVDATELEQLPEGAVIVSLEQWREHKDALAGREVGVRLLSDQHPESIADDLEHFSVIALDFPTYRDGRAYSYARILRDRYGYKGELRAVGDVLLEQLHYMHRIGFDSFDVAGDQPLEDWQAADADFNNWYQPTNDGRTTIRDRRNSQS